MHYIKQLCITAVVGVLLTACEKVIEVDLNSASPRYVIEGIVTDGTGPHQVRITQTKNFDESNTFDGIDFAEVIISDNAGNSEILAYAGDGIYQTSTLEGVPGRIYALRASIDGETFTSVSAMPEPAVFDSLYIETFTTFRDPVKIPYISYSDTPGLKNYYRHILYINGLRAPSIYINTDERNDGGQLERALPYFRGNEEDRLKAGDVVTVELQTIERAVYDYFFSLDQTIEQDAATPANPVSNITGGALGYFSAHSVQSNTVVVE
ncbi:hypothetical protein D770_14360 [Flammeovirgaceae bacterium 311]|nr:hypothetical protein D770_14360 [Flammeovirgaceae bacterium 311]